MRLATGTRACLSTSVCAAVAAQAISGITFSGDTISGSLVMDVTTVMYPAEAMIATQVATTWGTVSFEQVQVATGTPGFPGYYPCSPI